MGFCWVLLVFWKKNCKSNFDLRKTQKTKFSQNMDPEKHKNPGLANPDHNSVYFEVLDSCDESPHPVKIANFLSAFIRFSEDSWRLPKALQDSKTPNWPEEIWFCIKSRAVKLRNSLPGDVKGSKNLVKFKMIKCIDFTEFSKGCVQVRVRLSHPCFSRFSLIICSLTCKINFLVFLSWLVVVFFVFFK